MWYAEYRMQHTVYCVSHASFGYNLLIMPQNQSFLFSVFSNRVPFSWGKCIFHVLSGAYGIPLYSVFNTIQEDFPMASVSLTIRNTDQMTIRKTHPTLLFSFLDKVLSDLLNLLFQIRKQFYRAKLILLVAMLLLQWL